jgi:hypothetical protein
VLEPAAASSSASYASQSPHDRLAFRRDFEHDVEISGSMSLRCFMSTDAGFDIDVFVGIRKFDGTELPNFQHHRIFNCGQHTLHTGRELPSRLLVPVVARG